MGNKQSSLVSSERMTDGEKSVHYWFSIVLIQDVVIQLPLRDLKQFTRVCKSISKLARDYIQRNFWFKQHDNILDSFVDRNPEKRYLMYAPCNIKNVKNLSSLSINTTKIVFYPLLIFPSTFPIHLQQVTHIAFREFFNQQIGCGIKSEINNLPLTLTHLELSTWFTQSVDDLPPNLTFLSFSGEFNNRVDSLPPKLTHLTLSDKFNQPLDELPLSLTHLIFFRSLHSVYFIRSMPFNQPLDQLQKHFESNLEYLVLNLPLVERYESSIPPNFVRLGESKLDGNKHIVYKRQQQQKIITSK